MTDTPPADLTPTATRHQAPEGAAAQTHTFRLDNGLDVVVIPDRRVPVVTHMVWYRNGSADDPAGKSGIAHFLEHLMFKGTAKHPAGEFSKVVSALGGQENAFTSYDYTAYFQRVAKEHLGTMMEFEADRMTGLVLSDDVVDPERDVVLEERRMRVETDPAAQLGEAMEAALYVHHPYGTPIIGWMHEIEGLNRADALAYYERFYTPENAILVVAGDVDAEEVRALAEKTYGKVKPRGARPARLRTREPEPRALRRVTVADPKVEQPYVQRAYLVPSSRTQTGGEAYALDVLAEILGGGATSVLYRELVMKRDIAVSAGAYYLSGMLDDTRFLVYAVPKPDTSLEALDEALDGVLADFLARGVEPAELASAKTRLIAEMVYAADNQAHLARIYGAALAVGETVEEVDAWPARIEAVTAEEVVEAARRFLVGRRAVVGHLTHAD